MHMLEEHVIPWMERWKLGLGFHSEQGLESVHSVFNTIKRTYASVRNPLDRLHIYKTVKEHYLQNGPEVHLVKPPVKKRKL